jgi:hypothetical protein
MGVFQRTDRRRYRVTGALVAALAITGCGMKTTPRRELPQAARARGFVDTFDRVLVAGFVAPHVSDRGRDLDINVETARLFRTTLRSKGAFDVIESQPLDLRRTDSIGTKDEDTVFRDVAFWRRIGEEYREPLIVTGTVAFKAVGPQFEERTTGRGTVRVWRPGFKLSLRLVFISGRTGETLDSVSLGPVAMHALHARTSALALYFNLMDKLTPSMLAALGREAASRRTESSDARSNDGLCSDATTRSCSLEVNSWEE